MKILKPLFPKPTAGKPVVIQPLNQTSFLKDLKINLTDSQTHVEVVCSDSAGKWEAVITGGLVLISSAAGLALHVSS